MARSFATKNEPVCNVPPAVLMPASRWRAILEGETGPGCGGGLSMSQRESPGDKVSRPARHSTGRINLRQRPYAKSWQLWSRRHGSPQADGVEELHAFMSGSTANWAANTRPWSSAHFNEVGLTRLRPTVCWGPNLST
jgi:hypothetical protein